MECRFGRDGSGAGVAVNILFLTCGFDIACGRSRHVYTLITELTRRGHLCVLGTDGGPLLSPYLKRKLPYTHLPLNPEHKSLAHTLKTARRLIRFAGKYKIDIVHAHHRWPELIACLVSRVGNYRTVSTCHNFRQGRPRFSYRSERVIAVSRALASFLASEFGVPPHKLCTVPQAPRRVAAPSFEDLADFDVRHGVKKGERVAVCVGRFHREKGMDVVLSAAAMARSRSLPVRWFLVGSGEEEASLKAAVTAQQLNVTVLPDMESVGLIYTRADVLLVPSRQEAMPLVPLEAAAFRVPVVAAAVGGLPEVIRHNVTGKLVPPDDPLALLEATVDYLSHPDSADRCARNLQDFVRKHHSVDRMVSETESVYRALMATPRRFQRAR